MAQSMFATDTQLKGTDINHLAPAAFARRHQQLHRGGTGTNGKWLHIGTNSNRLPNTTQHILFY